jgi:HAD superfamily hydrolase (TIGR01484 family)
VAVSILTGRLYSGSRDIARSVNVWGPIACVDGSHIVRVSDDQELVSRSLSAEGAEGLRQLLLEDRPAAFVLALDAIAYDANGLPYLDYLKTWSRRVQFVGDVLDAAHWGASAAPTAAVVVGREKEVRRLRQGICASPALGLQAITFSLGRAGHGGSWGLVARRAGEDKGTAVAWMARHYGVTKSEIIAVGDWLNDIPMLRAAGRSFAMAQAPAKVLASATDRLESDASHGGGIAEAAERAGIL